MFLRILTFFLFVVFSSQSVVADEDPTRLITAEVIVELWGEHESILRSLGMKDPIDGLLEYLKSQAELNHALWKETSGYRVYNPEDPSSGRFKKAENLDGSLPAESVEEYTAKNKIPPKFQKYIIMGRGEDFGEDPKAVYHDLMGLDLVHLSEQWRAANESLAIEGLEVFLGFYKKARQFKQSPLKKELIAALDMIHAMWLERNSWAKNAIRYSLEWSQLSPSMQMADLNPLLNQALSLLQDTEDPDSQRIINVISQFVDRIELMAEIADSLQKTLVSQGMTNSDWRAAKDIDGRPIQIKDPEILDQYFSSRGVTEEMRNNNSLFRIEDDVLFENIAQVDNRYLSDYNREFIQKLAVESLNISEEVLTTLSLNHPENTTAQKMMQATFVEKLSVLTVSWLELNKGNENYHDIALYLKTFDSLPLGDRIRLLYGLKTAVSLILKSDSGFLTHIQSDDRPSAIRIGQFLHEQIERKLEQTKEIRELTFSLLQDHRQNLIESGRTEALSLVINSFGQAIKEEEANKYLEDHGLSPENYSIKDGLLYEDILRVSLDRLSQGAINKFERLATHTALVFESNFANLIVNNDGEARDAIVQAALDIRERIQLESADPSQEILNTAVELMSEISESNEDLASEKAREILIEAASQLRSASLSYEGRQISLEDWELIAPDEQDKYLRPLKNILTKKLQPFNSRVGALFAKAMKNIELDIELVRSIAARIHANYRENNISQGRTENFHTALDELGQAYKWKDREAYFQLYGIPLELEKEFRADPNGHISQNIINTEHKYLSPNGKKANELGVRDALKVFSWIAKTYKSNIEYKNVKDIWKSAVDELHRRWLIWNPNKKNQPGFSTQWSERTAGTNLFNSGLLLTVFNILSTENKLLDFLPYDQGKIELLRQSLEDLNNSMKIGELEGSLPNETKFSQQLSCQSVLSE